MYYKIIYNNYVSVRSLLIIIESVMVVHIRAPIIETKARIVSMTQKFTSV